MSTLPSPSETAPAIASGVRPGAKAPSSRKRSITCNRLRLLLTPLAGCAHLPYGQQRLVEIAIALAQRPKLLLLDDPAAGVPSSESHLILDVISRLDPDITILITEHDMDVVFRFAGRITVLVSGAVLTEGTPEEISADERVRAVYLGEKREARYG